MNDRWIKHAKAVSACALGLGVLFGSQAATAAWPEKPVTIIVPAGAGGGTDATARLLAVRLEAKFKQTFNVVNIGEGGGVVGITKIAAARPDGYTLGVLFNFAHYKQMGQTKVDASSFVPIAQYNFDPASLTVQSASPYKDARQLIDAIKAKPEKFNTSCGGGCGGSWPLAYAGLMASQGVAVDKLQMIPAQGASAGMLDLAAGTIDVVPCSLPEAAAMVSAGKARSLVVLGSARNPAFPDVPTAKEALGSDYVAGAWRGVVAPAKTPPAVVTAVEAALKEIVADPAFAKEMQDRGFGVQWRDRAAFGAFMNSQETEVAKLINALGLAKK